MVDTRPLLKAFGTLANVSGQIATDKAVNARRERPKLAEPLDIANGTLVEVTIDAGTGSGQARVPPGAQAALLAGSELTFGQNPGFVNWTIANGRLTVTFYADGSSGTMRFWVF